MLKNLLYNFTADNRNRKSLASKSREKRFLFFKSLINTLPRPLTILDVGGTQHFWEAMNFTPLNDITIYLINLDKIQVTHRNFISVQGDATQMKQFKDRQFDVVFSNSVIEHLYSWENQQKMAAEIRRVGKKYFVQTPNYWFPVEPHFVFPFFQYLPKMIRINLTERYTLGHYPRASKREKAKRRIEEIRLLTIREMRKLFPNEKIYKEKFMGLTKSIIAHNFN